MALRPIRSYQVTSSGLVQMPDENEHALLLEAVEALDELDRLVPGLLAAGYVDDRALQALRNFYAVLSQIPSIDQARLAALDQRLNTFSGHPTKPTSTILNRH